MRTVYFNRTNDVYLGVHRCWWRMLETKCVGDKFVMLVTDSGFWWPIKYIEKITKITKKVANIMILRPTSKISHHHKVTNITMSPTSLSPYYSIWTLVNVIQKFWVKIPFQWLFTVIVRPYIFYKSCIFGAQNLVYTGNSGIPEFPSGCQGNDLSGEHLIRDKIPVFSLTVLLQLFHGIFLPFYVVAFCASVI